MNYGRFGVRPNSLTVPDEATDLSPDLLLAVYLAMTIAADDDD